MSNMKSPRSFLDELYRIAVAAAHPACCLVHRLPDPPPHGRIILLAAGKAAGSMTEVAERHYIDDLGLPPSRLVGAAVTRRGYVRPTRIIRITEAGHPVPGGASFGPRGGRHRGRRGARPALRWGFRELDCPSGRPDACRKAGSEPRAA